MVRIPIPFIIHLTPSDNDRNRWDGHHLGTVELAISGHVWWRPQRR